VNLAEQQAADTNRQLPALQLLIENEDVPDWRSMSGQAVLVTAPFLTEPHAISHS